jgi:hypothetical protein
MEKGRVRRGYWRFCQTSRPMFKGEFAVGAVPDGVRLVASTPFTVERRQAFENEVHETFLNHTAFLGAFASLQMPSDEDQINRNLTTRVQAGQAARIDLVQFRYRERRS